MNQMTEDIFGDGSADFGDDFSLASGLSGIDDINYDDPFNSNQNNSDGIQSDAKKFESLTVQGSTSNAKYHVTTTNLRIGPRTTIGEKPNLSELSASLFDASRDGGNIRKIVDDRDQRLSFFPSGKEVTALSTKPPLVMNKKDTKKKKQPSYSVLKPETVAVKARKMSTKNLIKSSKSEGFLTLALRGKRYSSPRMNAMGEAGDPIEMSSGKANASWDNGTHSSSVDGLDYRKYSLPTGKSSSMRDLLLQSKAKCRSQFLLRQSSAHSLSKRNSFQSIKYVNEKLDVSSLLPAKQYAKSTSDSRRFSFPNVATATTRSISSKNRLGNSEIPAHQSSNDGTGNATESLLHEACRLFPNSDTVVETALRVDPDAVRRSVIFTGDQDGKSNSSLYGYPINLALAHGASEKILKLLVQSGSDVLAFKDGTNCGASLGVALSSKTCNLATVDLLLSANNQCAQIADRRGNYPLHIAVSYGRSVDIVMRLYGVYPKALGMRNFHSQTPLDIAIQSLRCPEEVTDFLRSVACRSADETVMNTKKADTSSQSFGSLEDGLDDIMQINLMMK